MNSQKYMIGECHIILGITSVVIIMISKYGEILIGESEDFHTSFRFSLAVPASSRKTP